MQFTVNSVHRGSISLVNAFKALAPRGLTLRIDDGTSAKIYFKDGEYWYKYGNWEPEVMEGAWYALESPSISLTVLKSPITHISKPKDFND